MGEGQRRTDGLSVVIPCYNEEPTLATCVAKVLEIMGEDLPIEIVIVDDCSTDSSFTIAQELAVRHPEIVVRKHEKNRGKGAALRTGFQIASMDFVAVQDADLEYNPAELVDLVEPLRRGVADVVLGSRFLTMKEHRVLYFWHSLGNRFLTLLSNMLTDLNLTDMETCYKVFRRDVIQKIEIEEERFGVEPEVIAKIARMRLRIYEMGISYYGRTYEEGKKIGVRDGVRALYCILKYNAHNAPVPIQFFLYLLIGGTAAVFNLFCFVGLLAASASVTVSAITAYLLAAALNYALCVLFLFRHRARWNSGMEVTVYIVVIAVGAALDLIFTRSGVAIGAAPSSAKAWASILVLLFNFAARKYLVFPERKIGPWKSQYGRVA